MSNIPSRGGRLLLLIAALTTSFWLYGCALPSSVENDFAQVGTISVGPGVKLPDAVVLSALEMRMETPTGYTRTSRLNNAWLQNRGVDIEKMMLASAQMEVGKLAEVLKPAASGGKPAVLELEVTSYGFAKGWGASAWPYMHIITRLRLTDAIVWEKRSGNSFSAFVESSPSFQEAIRPAVMQAQFQKSVDALLADTFRALEQDLKARPAATLASAPADSKK